MHAHDRRSASTSSAGMLCYYYVNDKDVPVTDDNLRARLLSGIPVPIVAGESVFSSTTYTVGKGSTHCCGARHSGLRKYCSCVFCACGHPPLHTPKRP